MSALYNSHHHFVHLSSCSGVWMRKYGILSIIIILRSQITTLTGVWPIGPPSLQWHERGSWSLKHWQLKCCYTDCSSVQQQQKQKPSSSWLACLEGNPLGNDGFPHKVPVMRKTFPWRDVNMVVPFYWHWGDWNPHLDHRGICVWNYFSFVIAIIQMSKQNARLWTLWRQPMFRHYDRNVRNFRLDFVGENLQGYSITRRHHQV